MPTQFLLLKITNNAKQMQELKKSDKYRFVLFRLLLSSSLILLCFLSSLRFSRPQFFSYGMALERSRLLARERIGGVTVQCACGSNDGSQDQGRCVQVFTFMALACDRILKSNVGWRCNTFEEPLCTFKMPSFVLNVHTKRRKYNDALFTAETVKHASGAGFTAAAGSKRAHLIQIIKHSCPEHWNFLSPPFCVKLQEPCAPVAVTAVVGQYPTTES